MQNLTMLGDLHRQGKIRMFGLNYVVQRDNLREMSAFVELGRSLGVDRVQFQCMRNYGNLTEQEYLERCLVINDRYLDYELWKVLQDPIFQDPIVDLHCLARYFAASKKRYGKK